jgi:hypothetical protein
MVSIVLSPWADTRAYARTLLASVTIAARAAAMDIIARAIAVMLSFADDAASESRRRAREGGETLLRAFPRPLRGLGLDVLHDLVRHPLAGVQTFAADVLLAHDIRPEDLPEELIVGAGGRVEARRTCAASGCACSAACRTRRCSQRVNLLLAFATSALADQRGAIRPVLQRLARRTAASATLWCRRCWSCC